MEHTYTTVVACFSISVAVKSVVTENKTTSALNHSNNINTCFVVAYNGVFLFLVFIHFRTFMNKQQILEIIRNNTSNLYIKYTHPFYESTVNSININIKLLN